MLVAHSHRMTPVDDIRRGDIVKVWDPRSDRFLKRIFIVLSNERFHRNGRDEVQVVEIWRPYKPTPVVRTRIKRLGSVFEAKPGVFEQIAREMRDYISPGSYDELADGRSRPGAQLWLDVTFSDGRNFETHPVVVVSRPLLFNAHDVLFFMDMSTGAPNQVDYVLERPTRIGSFVKARLFWVDRREMELYNKDRNPPGLQLADLLGSVNALDRVLELDCSPAWQQLVKPE